MCVVYWKKYFSVLRLFIYIIVIGNRSFFFRNFDIIGLIKLLYFLNFFMFGSFVFIFKKIFGRFIFSVIIIGFFKFICFVRVRIDFGVIVVVKSKCNVFLNI